MAVINHQNGTITYRILFAGANGSGKSDNVQALAGIAFPEDEDSNLVNSAVPWDDQAARRTGNRHVVTMPVSGSKQSMAYLSLPLGEDHDFSVRLQVSSLPAGKECSAKRHEVLADADGVVFVIDPMHIDPKASIDAWNEVIGDLESLDIEPSTLPILLQFNYRSNECVGKAKKLSELINRYNLPEIDAATSTGYGVTSTMKAAYGLVSRALHHKLGGPPNRDMGKSIQRCAVTTCATSLSIADATDLHLTDPSQTQIAAARAEAKHVRVVESSGEFRAVDPRQQPRWNQSTAMSMSDIQSAVAGADPPPAALVSKAARSRSSTTTIAPPPATVSGGIGAREIVIIIAVSIVVLGIVAAVLIL